MKKKYLVSIVGPTGIGKTNLAIRVAKALNCDIISADSRQIYRELSIGTAKPNVKEMSGVKHHFIDHLSVKDSYNAGIYEQEAMDVLETLFRNHNYVVMVGGTGLYFNAVWQGFDDLPSSPKLREELNALWKTQGLLSLQNRLRKVSKKAFANLDTDNPHRLIRAIEIAELKPKGPSSKGKRAFNILKIGLNSDRKSLYTRIDSRVDKMIAAGLENEVRHLIPFQNLQALQTVGYSEFFSYFNNAIDLKECLRLIKRNSRRYAKRQLTWFRRDNEINWFEPDQVDEILSFIQENSVKP